MTPFFIDSFFAAPVGLSGEVESMAVESLSWCFCRGKMFTCWENKHSEQCNRWLHTKNNTLVTRIHQVACRAFASAERLLLNRESREVLYCTLKSTWLTECRPRGTDDSVGWGHAHFFAMGAETAARISERWWTDSGETIGIWGVVTVRSWSSPPKMRIIRRCGTLEGWQNLTDVWNVYCLHFRSLQCRPRYLLRAQGPGNAELEIAEVQVHQRKEICILGTGIRMI